MKPKFTNIGSQRIAWYENNDTAAMPVIFFVHGNSSSAKSFRYQFESNLSDKYRLIAIDLPGHGESEPASEPGEIYTLPGYASIISAFSDATGIKNAVFVGWSLGGHILLEAAEKLPKASGFVIFGTPPAGNPPDMASAFLPSPAMASLFKEELTDNEISEWSGAILKSPPESFISDIEHTDGRARLEMGKSVAEGNYRDEIEVVSSLSVPLSIFHGEEDQIVNLKYIKELKIPALWRNNVQVIKGVGHAPQWEQPEKFNRLMEEFIRDVRD